MKNHLFAILLLFSINVYAEEMHTHIGYWDAYDRAHQAIYGYIEIRDKTIRWGMSNEGYGGKTCSAGYKLTTVTEKQEYYFELIDKQCAYETVKNGHIHEKLAAFRFTIVKDPKYGYVRAKFIDYDHKGKSMGSGSFMYGPLPETYNKARQH